MVSNKITEGVGKKIVEALKMQSDIEINNGDESPAAVEESNDFENNSSDIEFVDNNDFENQQQEMYHQPQEMSFEHSFEQNNSFTSSYQQPSHFEQPVMPGIVNFNNSTIEKEHFSNELEGFEMPANVAVLKQLINQLPAGVSKQTGAQIIRQTMEALGISMKGVLQEAQQVQEGLNNSAKECQATIMDYKKQISILERQAQKYHRQYSALNDIISLFIQTSN